MAHNSSAPRVWSISHHVMKETVPPAHMRWDWVKKGGFDMLIAWTADADGEIAFAAFAEHSRNAAKAILSQWPGVELERGDAAGGVREGAFRVVGTPFQASVWRALLNIPRGECLTYGELAAALGRPRSARAVGGAVAANHVALLLPCHRVVARGSQAGGGYRWGIERKRAILAHEGIRL